jgi:tripartite-type tricarboxylate transporter receptor subunit TctC
MKIAIRKSEKPRRRSAPRGNERRLVTQHPRRRILSLAAGAAAMPAVSRMAWGQVYPTRPVRIVVGFAAGGPLDIVARLIGQRLSERLGQQFIVENRPGAGSNIATEAVVNARPDGHTLLMIGSSNVINPTLYDKLNYNFVRDIIPVASISGVPLVLQIHPSVPAKTVPEFIAYAKANPDKISMASAGIGNSTHVAGELFKMMTGVNMVHVPYRGAGPALADLIGGQVQVLFGTPVGMMDYVNAGKLSALAVTTAMRLEMLPDLPTVGEFVPGYEVNTVNGIGTPKSTPAEIINKLNNEINLGLADPKIKAAVADLGGMVLPGSPAEFSKFITGEIEKWGKVIRAANIKPE